MGGAVNPPSSVLDYPHFASLVNGVFSMYNGLRVFPVLECLPEIAREMQAALSNCAAQLFEARETVIANEGEQVFNQACFIFSENVVPAVTKGLFHVYGVRDDGLFDVKAIVRPVATFSNAILLANLESVESPTRVAIDRSDK